MNRAATGLTMALAFAGCKAQESTASTETAALTPASTATGATAPSAPPAGSRAGANGEQYFPLQSYRVGPSVAGGTGFFELLRPIIEESAARYAQEKGITPRDCSKEI